MGLGVVRRTRPFTRAGVPARLVRQWLASERGSTVHRGSTMKSTVACQGGRGGIKKLSYELYRCRFSRYNFVRELEGRVCSFLLRSARSMDWWNLLGLGTSVLLRRGATQSWIQGGSRNGVTLSCLILLLCIRH